MRPFSSVAKRTALLAVATCLSLGQPAAAGPPVADRQSLALPMLLTGARQSLALPVNAGRSSPAWIIGSAAAMGFLGGVAAWASFTRRQRPALDFAAPAVGRQSDSTIGAPRSQDAHPVQSTAAPAPRDPFALLPVACAVATFHQWLLEYRDQPDVWSAFDQVVRESLAEHFHAARVRLYHLDTGPEGCGLRPMAVATRLDELSGGDDLGATASGAATVDGSPVPLEGAATAPPAGAVFGETILEHVALTGREFYAHETARTPLLRDLAARSAVNWTWVWPIRDGRTSLGLLAVGSLGERPLAREIRHLLGHALTLCWRCVAGSEQLHLAQRTDRGSGVLNRTDFFPIAARALAEAYQENEPVVVAVLTLEGLRRVDDQGWWRGRDQAIGCMGQTILKRLRSDDRVGRFADDRFVLLLRRLDLGLGRLIVEKLVAAIEESLREVDWPRGPSAGESGAAPGAPASPLRVRVGLAASGFTRLELEPLLAKAMEAVDQARRDGTAIGVAAAGAERNAE